MARRRQLLYCLPGDDRRSVPEAMAAASIQVAAQPNATAGETNAYSNPATTVATTSPVA
jgi:hypothetical protein